MMRGNAYVFDDSTLVLEGVTLAFLIEFMIEMLVDLASSSVLDEKPTKHPESSHPQDLTR